MMWQTAYSPKKTENIFKFAKTQDYATLITHFKNDVQIGLFNPLFQENKLYLHLNKNDVQIRQLNENPQAKLTFTEILTLIPSYWVDPNDGGKATMYYRHLELQCSSKIYNETTELLPILQKMLQHYQNEGGYQPLAINSKIYQSAFATLSIVELTPKKQRTRWKLGQNLPIEKRKEIVAKLIARGKPSDLKAAQLIEKSWQ